MNRPASWGTLHCLLAIDQIHIRSVECKLSNEKEGSIICHPQLELQIHKMVFLHPSVHLSLLASSLSASYLPTSQVLPTYTIPNSSHTSLDSPPPYPDSYDYVNYAIPRDDSYAGIDSYGVPVGEPLLRVPAPDQDHTLDYYSKCPGNINSH